MYISEVDANAVKFAHQTIYDLTGNVRRLTDFLTTFLQSQRRYGYWNLSGQNTRAAPLGLTQYSLTAKRQIVAYSMRML
jgi:hypothetical protein